MFYYTYLSGICDRRSWPQPVYEPYRTRYGFCCKVRVNNREYGADIPYKTVALAQESAAMQAFMIVRNFSANDGRLPGQRPGQAVSTSGMVQGRPAPIGSGRTSNRNSNSSVETDSYSDNSGSVSPRSFDGGFERPIAPMLDTASQQIKGRSSRSMYRSRVDSSGYMCLCGRGAVAQYGQCMTCLQNRGWVARP